jgi:hypothetical protein
MLLALSTARQGHAMPLITLKRTRHAIQVAKYELTGPLPRLAIDLRIPEVLGTIVDARLSPGEKRLAIGFSLDGQRTMQIVDMELRKVVYTLAEQVTAYGQWFTWQDDHTLRFFRVTERSEDGTLLNTEFTVAVPFRPGSELLASKKPSPEVSFLNLSKLERSRNLTAVRALESAGLYPPATGGNGGTAPAQWGFYLDGHHAAISSDGQLIAALARTAADATYRVYILRRGAGAWVQAGTVSAGTIWKIDCLGGWVLLGVTSQRLSRQDTSRTATSGSGRQVRMTKTGPRGPVTTDSVQCDFYTVSR